MDRFRARRRRLFELRWEATRLRERPVVLCLFLVLAANIVVFWSMASAAADGTLALDRVVTYASAALTTSTIAFGGLSWALDGAAAPVAAVLRLRETMDPAGALVRGSRAASGMPAREIRFRNVGFAYPATGERVLDGLDLTIPAGSSLAIVGQNGAGKTTLAKLLCRLYDPQTGAIEVDGIDLRELDLDGWRSRLAAVFQDFIRFELPLRDNVAPAGAPDDAIRAALAEAGAAGLADLDTVLARGYEGGTELSGGQWQRVALARALCAVRQGAGVVLLDEPTAQLDVRGEAEIFDRILAATRHTTTILISHRFSTVRHADRICVLEGGRVVELGTHDELMAEGGRYRTMFDMQASRFDAADVPDEEGAELRCPLVMIYPQRSSPCGGPCERGYEAEPRFLVVAFGLSLLSALPDALLALWLKLLADGVLAHSRVLVIASAVGLGLSATATWFLRVMSDRTQRRFRERLTIALESHVAQLQASVATIEHHERPLYLNRLAVLRDQVFVLDHMYMSLFSTCGWILRLGVTVALVDVDPPGPGAPRRLRSADRAHVDVAAWR